MTAPPRAADPALAARDARWDALMLAAQAGEERAYATLLREAAPFLRAVIRRRIADPADAQDAAQDALLTVHQLRHACDPARPLAPWLAAIADRRAVDRLRRRSRTAGRESVLDDLPDAAAAVPPRAEDGIASLGCLRDLASGGVAGLGLGTSFECLRFIVLMGVPLTALMLWMARHAARIRPEPVAALAGLAAASLSSVALSLVHHLDSAAMILLWHGMSVLLVVALARVAGRRAMAGLARG